MALFGWTSWKVWRWQRSTAEFEFTGIINDPIRGKCKPAFVGRRRRLLRLQMACRSVARAERVSRGTASINPGLKQFSFPMPCLPIENERHPAFNALHQINAATGKYSVPAWIHKSSYLMHLNASLNLKWPLFQFQARFSKSSPENFYRLIDVINAPVFRGESKANSRDLQVFHHRGPADLQRRVRSVHRRSKMLFLQRFCLLDSPELNRVWPRFKSESPSCSPNPLHLYISKCVAIMWRKSNKSLPTNFDYGPITFSVKYAFTFKCMRLADAWSKATCIAFKLCFFLFVFF